MAIFKNHVTSHICRTGPNLYTRFATRSRLPGIDIYFINYSLKICPLTLLLFALHGLHRGILADIHCLSRTVAFSLLSPRCHHSHSPFLPSKIGFSFRWRRSPGPLKRLFGLGPTRLEWRIWTLLDFWRSTIKGNPCRNPWPGLIQRRGGLQSCPIVFCPFQRASNPICAVLPLHRPQ